MLLVLRALVVLGFASMLHASRKGRVVSVQLKQGAGASRSVRLVLDTSVLPSFSSKSNSNIANVSLSPWTYRDSFVASRLPRRISQAHCLTSGCLNLRGGGEDATLEAKPIQYQVLVLHRQSPKAKQKSTTREEREEVEEVRLHAGDPSDHSRLYLCET